VRVEFGANKLARDRNGEQWQVTRNQRTVDLDVVTAVLTLVDHDLGDQQPEDSRPATTCRVVLRNVDRQNLPERLSKPRVDLGRNRPFQRLERVGFSEPCFEMALVVLQPGNELLVRADVILPRPLGFAVMQVETPVFASKTRDLPVEIVNVAPNLTTLSRIEVGRNAHVVERRRAHRRIAELAYALKPPQLRHDRRLDFAALRPTPTVTTR
jgi:hypothetical protein